MTHGRETSSIHFSSYICFIDNTLSSVRDAAHFLFNPVDVTSESLTRLTPSRYR